MEFKRITEHCHYFHAAVNIGYISYKGKGLLIDTGIDESSIKKVLKILDSNGLSLDYCIITHAHADHFGGANYLKEKRNIPMYASKLEKAIIENSILEPIYLWNGANPLLELRNKFLEGQAVEVDSEINEETLHVGPFQLKIHSLPGHSYNQIGIEFDGILYAADSYFGVETLEKHGIPYITDLFETLGTLDKLLELELLGALPGHGYYEDDFKSTVKQNILTHRKLLQSLEYQIRTVESLEFHVLFKKFLEEYSISAKNIGQWLLFRTTYSAYIRYLVETEQIAMEMIQNEIILKARM